MRNGAGAEFQWQWKNALGWPPAFSSIILRRLKFALSPFVAFGCVIRLFYFRVTGARVAAAAVDSILRRDAKEKHNLVVKARLILDGFKSVSLPAMNLHIGYVDSFPCATFMVQFSHERRNKRLVLL